MPVIVHIDMNSFFASCEVKRNPELKGKKIIIGGMSNRSIVSAASYEAKKDGIYTPMPIYLAKEKCRDGIFLPVDGEYYYKVSKEIFSYLKSIYKIVDVVSIDEAFIDMSDVRLLPTPIEYFTNLQKTIYEKMHIPCSIGVSYNKFLAKMASDYKKPLGITFIRKNDIEKILHPIKIENMFGCGKATSAKLKEIGINKIGDLLTANQYQLKELLGNGYDYLINNAKGNYAEHVILHNEPIKSVGNSHTLDNNTDDYQTIKENLKVLCDEVSLRLKSNEMLGYTITLTLKNKDFVSKSKSKQIIEPTNDNDKIFIEILKLLDKTTLEIERLVGVSVSNLIYKDAYYEQLSIFSKEASNIDNTTELIKKLNKIAGKDIFLKAKDLKKVK